MKAVALSVWLFLNLGFFGMCGYIYLIWAQYWRSNSRSLYYELNQKSSYNPNDPVIFYESVNKNEKKILKSKRNIQTPRISVKNTGKLKCRENNCRSKNNTKLLLLKNEILLQLRRVLHDESSVFKTDNPYHVRYQGPRGSLVGCTASEIRCLLQKAGLRTLSKNDIPFNHLPIGEHLRDGKLFDSKHFHSCAIVSSAASLLDSGSGPVIDTHDVVVRFNHAPTINYEEDVGSRTDVRIVNSQVVTKKEFQFVTDDLYKNITVVVWDPSEYGASLEQWSSEPDFDFFKEWTSYRQAHSRSESVVLDPRSVWRVWDFLQSLTALRIRRNPPSSGFLGLTLMLQYCDYVDVFEFVPTSRMTNKCHYFDDFEDSSCTLGVWHPLAAEKLITLAMNELNDTIVFESGFVRIKGFRDLDC